MPPIRMTNTWSLNSEKRTYSKRLVFANGSFGNDSALLIDSVTLALIGFCLFLICLVRSILRYFIQAESFRLNVYKCSFGFYTDLKVRQISRDEELGFTR